MIAFNVAPGSPGGPAADDEAIAQDDLDRTLALGCVHRFARVLAVHLDAWDLLAATTTDGVLRAAQARKLADAFRRFVVRWAKRAPLSGPGAPAEAPAGTRRRRVRPARVLPLG